MSPVQTGMPYLMAVVAIIASEKGMEIPFFRRLYKLSPKICQSEIAKLNSSNASSIVVMFAKSFADTAP